MRYTPVCDQIHSDFGNLGLLFVLLLKDKTLVKGKLYLLFLNRWLRYQVNTDGLLSTVSDVKTS